ncbi:hypothetical protein N7492_001399 [Penicillium capsulatum]|uniref:Uncharacterized protein n=1 Tax=Penicillium capsulatum TaxID=69766 RepID=A0A9W9IT66_9EURO|nr:hypothetical protein N7492_001399 [Penicillium capsulatum]KAJ6129546.1 hypothetical protein N7512_002326 [Penicillium capsulatum]
MDVHVVSKKNNQQHATFTLHTPPRKLPDSSVRVRVQLISLSSNNLSYARMGEALRWWDTYPVSKSYPAPYNDSSTWGNVPAWGFAAVEESTISELAPGTLLYGFWPTSAAPADLKLEASYLDGHWTEISEHRKSLMPLYNRYKQTSVSQPVSTLSRSPSSEAQAELEHLAWSAVLIWKSGYFLSEHVFPPYPEKQTPIHPLGHQPGLSWTTDDGDISSAAVISLAASTKTARSLAYFLERRPSGSGPLGFLQVTSSVASLSEASQKADPPFPSKSVEYSQIDSHGTVAWLKNINPYKIVVIDFGARSNTLKRLLEAIKDEASLQPAQVVIVHVGSEQKVITPEETLANRKAMTELGKIQYNTSGIEDSLLQTMGMGAFYETLDAKGKQMRDDRQQWLADIKIVWGRGVSGTGGIEGAWDRLCQGQVGSNEALVYHVQPE